MGGEFRVGLLGHGTVGAAFDELLAERADEIERFNGMRPGARRRAHPLARRLRGDPRGIGPDRRGDGRDRTGAGVSAAGDERGQARRHRQQAAALPARRGAVRDRPREHDVRLRFEAAVAGAVPVVRVLEESLSATPIERIHGIVNGTSNYILTEMTRRLELRGGARARRSASATPRPTRATTSPAATPPPRWRSSRGSPSARRCTSTRSATRASSTSRATTSQYARELDLGLKLVGTAERRAGRALGARLSRPSSTRAIRSPAISGPFNAVTVESETITEITLSGPGRGRPPDRERGARRRRQRDDRRRQAARAAAGAAADRGRRERLLPAPRRRRPARACWRRSRRCSASTRSRSSPSSSAAWASTRGS